MILRSIGIWLCEGIFEAIPKMYSIFYNLANARFFTEDDTIIEELSSNIYVLVSVIMLFIFSATFLSAIVNPDVVNDKKKGIGALLKRAFIGIILIILIPFGFDKVYEIQSQVMDNHLIEKILVGINYSSDEDAQNGGNGGQVIAGTLIASVLYPEEDGIKVSADFAGSYKSMVQENINEIEHVADYINLAPEDEYADKYKYALHFDGLIAIIAGIGTLYILLLFAMDMAVRMFSLAFYELTAPISVVAYMAIGDDQLKRWLKAVGGCIISAYLRIAAMAFYVFLLSRITLFLNRDQFANADWQFLLRVLLLVGMLIFAKKVPDLIEGAFGLKIESKGGIGGRLGQMALAGGIAKGAWDKAKGALGKGVGAVGKGVGRLATAPLAAAGAGIGYGVGKLWNGTKNGKIKGLKNTGFGNAIGHAGAYLGGGTKGLKKYHEGSDYSKQKGTEADVKRQQKTSANFRNKLNAAAGENVIDDNGNIINKKGVKAQETLQDMAKRDNTLNSTQKDATTGLMEAKSQKAAYDQMMTSRKAITSAIDTAKSNTNLSSEQISRLDKLQSDFKGGKLSNDEFVSQVKGMVEDGTLTKSAGAGIAGNIDKMINTMNTTKVKTTDENGHVVEKLMSEVVTKDGKGGTFDMNVLKDQAKKSENAVTAAQSTYDKVAETASATQKETMSTYISKSEDADGRATWERTGGTEENKITVTQETAVKEKGKTYKNVIEEAVISTTASSSSSSSTGGSSGGSSGSSSSGDSSGGSSGSSSTGGSSGGSSGSSSTGGSSGSSSSGSSQDYSDDDIMDMMSNASIAAEEERQIKQNINQSTDATGDFYQNIYDNQSNNSPSSSSSTGGNQSNVDNSTSDVHSDSGNEWQDMMDLYNDED